ncbi:MAG TPA: hypothetical protein VK914_11940 [bacterium]|jgi:hypothetical protein|nr:hypothetical protein [bacterium]
MSFLKNDLSTIDVVEGVMPWLPPSPDEVLRCDEAALAAGGLAPERVLHEFFLLKSALGLEYGLGLLEKLGLRREGMEQYHAFYIHRLAEGLALRFPGQEETAVGLLAARLKAYTAALHNGLHPEDPHLAVADAFTRFCGAADERALVTLCLDACKAMNARFLGALTEFGLG